MYFGQGMNPKDICLLQYKNIAGDFLEFERAKTEDSFQEAPPRISMFLTKDMLQTIADYGNKKKSPENYIFPIFEPGMTPLRQYETVEYFTKFLNKWMQYILNVYIPAKVTPLFRSNLSPLFRGLTAVMQRA
jgi:hypothetical protein